MYGAMPGSYNRFFQGKIDPRLSDAVALADHFNIDLNYFKKYVPKENKTQQLLKRIEKENLTDEQLRDLEKILK